MALDFRPGAQRADLLLAYPDRLAEAVELFNGARYGSAIALALYGLEIYLKVRICVRLDLEALPKAFQLHDLDGLMILAGLKRTIENLGPHPVKVNWDFLKSSPTWNQHANELRYKSNAHWTQAQAAEILRCIQDPNEGVLPWLSAQP